MRPERDCELWHFRSRARTDEEAVSDAALARRPNGKRHPHQYRIPLASLRKSRRLLLKNLPKIRRKKSFQELIDLVEDLTEEVERWGELAVYDTALRIGARFGLEPEKVYVHRGTRDGVHKLRLDGKLRFDGRRETIELDDLPAPIRKLKPREAEDFLCIYKKRLPSRWRD